LLYDLLRNVKKHSRKEEKSSAKGEEIAYVFGLRNTMNWFILVAGFEESD